MNELNDIFFPLLTILLFLLISAFFSAAETSLTAVSRARLYQLVMDGNKRAQLVSRLRREKESLIGTILLGNNVVNIASSAIATSLSLRLFGEGEGLLIVTLVMTLLVVVFTEILPKTYAIQNAETVALKLSPVLNICVKILNPVTHSIQWFIRMLLKLFGVDITQANTLISATDVVRGTIELHHREGTMIKQDRDMLGSILDLNDIEVRHIMIHRKSVDTIDAGQPAEKIIQEAVSIGHSRIPLWRNNPDNIVGILHVKTLIKELRERDNHMDTETILSIAAKPWFIPETTSLRSQLLAFRSKRQHFALVVDEYGALQGIVTLEDIIEEIVGHIEDEHDETRSDLRKVGVDSYMVRGSVTVRDLNRELDWALPDEAASTIAGLVIHDAGRIPAIGETVEHHGVRFTILDRTRNQITRVKLEKLALPESAGMDA